MTTRQKFEPEINRPFEIEMLFDEPISGESKYGHYHLYAIKVQNSEYSFFPPDDVHSQIRNLKKGDRFILTKLAAQRGSKLITQYEVKILNGKEELEDDSENNETLLDDNYYSIMLQSYKDAIKITTELNGMADPSRIAITLFIARSKSIGNGNNY